MERQTNSVEYAPGFDLERHIRLAKSYRRVALTLALFPMSVGVVILGLFWLTDWRILPILGFFMLPVGGILVLVGIVFAILWAVQLKLYAQAGQTRTNWLGVLGMFGLLFSNLGVAYLCAAVGRNLAFPPAMEVSLSNSSGMPIDVCVVSTARERFVDGPVAINGSTSRIVKLRHSGKIHVHLEQAGAVRDFDLALPLPIDEMDGNAALIEVDPGLVVHEFYHGPR